MNAKIKRITLVPDEADLLQQGFTAEQVQRLVALRDRYPLIEFVTSRAALNRLTFLRWYYDSRRIVD